MKRGAIQSLRAIRHDTARDAIVIIDQTRLPHQLQERTISSLEDACEAIACMRIRGAPLIGIVAAFGMSFALRDGWAREDAYRRLLATRPTAINLQWALQRVMQATDGVAASGQMTAAATVSRQLLKEDAAACSAIGDHGQGLLETLWRRRRGEGAAALNLLTHCNAGWLATAAWGTALAPIYKAHDAGIPVHVWVDETRPRNQGAALTAWELGQAGIPHTLIVDNAGGHLMQQGRVDACLVGSDRTTADGDVVNKIGTYLKALAARDNDLPFYVALPVSTIDFENRDGAHGVSIEERSPDEVLSVQGLTDTGRQSGVRIAPPGTDAFNAGFDVTPARLVSALITERGIVEPNRDALRRLLDQRVPSPAAS